MPRKPAPRAKRAYARRPRYAKKTSPRLKKIVNSAIDRRCETKEQVSYVPNVDILTAVLGTPTSAKLLPEPVQGDGDSDRVGNAITLKKCVITGVVNMKPFDTTTNPTNPAPMLIKMWIVSSKVVNTNTFSNTPASSSFFTVNNSSTGFQNNMRDQLLPVNTDLFTVHKTKTFKIGYGSLSGANQSTNVGTACDNSPSAQRFTIDCSKYVSKLKFDESQTWATNKNLFCVITATRCDGTAASATLANCEWHYVVHTQYKDY